jgi:hypothetical protein
MRKHLQHRPFWLFYRDKLVMSMFECFHLVNTTTTPHLFFSSRREEILFFVGSTRAKALGSPEFTPYPSTLGYRLFPVGRLLDLIIYYPYSNFVLLMWCHIFIRLPELLALQ